MLATMQRCLWQMKKQRSITTVVLTGVLLTAASCVAQGKAASKAATKEQTPGCEGLDARECLLRAIEAMGGREKLAAITTEQLDLIGHTELMEQSYRQAPFITSYTRD